MAETVECRYCNAPCDGSLRDIYGEFVLRRPLPVCAECDEHFQQEPGPWDGWGD